MSARTLKTGVIDEIKVNIPERGRLGDQIQSTFRSIVRGGAQGKALHVAMGLSGRASKYSGRYKTAFVRFADANADILEPGPFGERGGWGYKYHAA